MQEAPFIHLQKHLVQKAARVGNECPARVQSLPQNYRLCVRGLRTHSHEWAPGSRRAEFESRLCPPGRVSLPGQGQTRGGDPGRSPRAEPWPLQRPDGPRAGRAPRGGPWGWGLPARRGRGGAAGGDWLGRAGSSGPRTKERGGGRPRSRRSRPPGAGSVLGGRAHRPPVPRAAAGALRAWAEAAADRGTERGGRAGAGGARAARATTITRSRLRLPPEEGLGGGARPARLRPEPGGDPGGTRGGDRDGGRQRRRHEARGAAAVSARRPDRDLRAAAPPARPAAGRRCPSSERPPARGRGERGAVRRPARGGGGRPAGVFAATKDVREGERPRWRARGPASTRRATWCSPR